MNNAAPPVLKNLEILLIDCQATTSRPETGFLLELGWVKARASEIFDTAGIEQDTQAFLLTPPPNAAIPPQVLKITGIQLEDLKNVHSQGAIWDLLQEEAHRTATQGDLWPCPAVIHYARYEAPFLSRLHAEHGNGSAFPLNIVCTHQIIQRLYPGLPRKGLRAVAGFFGYALPELRRCRHHVLATALIWRHLVEKLESEQGITNLEELQTWLAQPSSHLPSQKIGRVYPMDKKLRQGLPQGPGLYRMYRLNGDSLYVGKAKSLKYRVNSYFQPQGRHSEHILEMLSQAKDLTYTPTQSALEAALKESDEIKRLRPLFNRALQANGRDLCYVSPDLKTFTPAQPDARHPLGPFASFKHILPLGVLMDLLNGDLRRVSGRVMQNILDLPREYLPDRPVFKQGLRDLRLEYPILASESVDIAALKSLGARLWRNKLMEALRRSAEPEPENPETDTSEEVKSEPGIWTRERAARAIKSIIRSSTHQIRRAGWLLRLSESRLMWSTRCDAELKHTAVVHETRVTFLDPSERGLDSFSHPGAESDLEARRVFFNIAAYDRMRVLTTEIRRLVQENRDVELYLVPNTRLSTAQLARLLPWV